MKRFYLLTGLLLSLFTCSSQILISLPLYDLQIGDEEYNNKWNEASIKILFIYFAMILDFLWKPKRFSAIGNCEFPS